MSEIHKSSEQAALKQELTPSQVALKSLADDPNLHARRIIPAMWDEYLRVTANNQANSTVIKATNLLKSIKNLTAIDIGCGAGRDSQYLLDKDFTVVAIDYNPAVKEYLMKLRHQERLRIVISEIEAFSFGSYNLVNASFSLPFVTKNKFNGVFRSIRRSVKVDGVFAGQLFGVNDEWNTPGSNINFHTRDEVYMLFEDYKKVDIKETNKDGQAAVGQPKHWHYFDIVAQK
ncbi:class I SAM-dependent methyltransferase [Candidatus Saccharibacteria bacterium]|nr:class I SAM-dependent methyltransferase [Candidatus Saccharibacteria bacterium]